MQVLVTTLYNSYLFNVFGERRPAWKKQEYVRELELIKLIVKAAKKRIREEREGACFVLHAGSDKYNINNCCLRHSYSHTH